MRVDLTDNIVLVTGASRGIGAAVARGMAQAGAAVAVHCGRNRHAAAAVVADLGNGAASFEADLADPEGPGDLWDRVERHYGRIDVLVNNAGIAVSSPMEAGTTAWLQDWDRTQAVNLRAPASLCRSALRHFVARRGGRIINVASRAAFRGDEPEFLAYAASKGGLVALTRSIARGYGKAGVTAFTVAPGFTRTDMAQDFLDRYGEDHLSNDIALVRLTEPEDVAPTIVFLASGLADHATGATIDINAGSYVR